MFICSWCNHLNEADVNPVKAVKCNHCGKWLYSPDDPAPELPTCSKCGEKMHGTVCVKCLPKF